MVPLTSRELRLIKCLRFVLSFALSLVAFGLAQAQTVTYRLHREASTTANHFQLNTANPDASSLAVQSANLKNLANGEYLIKEFDTQSGVPAASGIITAGSTISVEVWMRKTASAGTMFPRVKIKLNSTAGASIGTITGSTQLSTTNTKYTLTGTVPANVSMTTSDRFYLWVGVDLTGVTGVNNRGELSIEGTLNGNHDSKITVPLPNATGSLAGTITRASDSAPINGALIEALQGGVVEAFSSSAANGSYAIWSVDAGTYDVRVSAVGYQTVVQTGVVVTAGNSTTVDKSLATVSPGDITYIHDELGRLVGVVTASEVATYSYDDVGNLLAISRGNASLVSVIEFTPNGGGVGTEVTIFGTGFSNTPSQNTVKFNGVTATVTSSNPTQIVTTVPVGATTGPISVTTSSGTGVSSTSFIVGNLLPTISSFSPVSGDVGTSVGITGTNFDPVFHNNKVKFHLADSHVSASSTTSITTTVPTGATSGPITVIAPEGSATSASDFFVAPPGHTATAIAISGRMSIGDVLPITFTTPGKIALLVFSGVAGQRINLGLSGVTLGSPCCTNVGGATIYKPDGTTLLSPAGFMQDGLGSPTLILPVTGTYTILIDPEVNNVGNVTITLSEELASAIGIDGPTVPLSFTAGRNARLTFSGTTGQRITVGLNGVTLGSPCCTPVGGLALYKPDGTALLSPVGFMQDGYGTATLELPVAGTYAITIDPALALTGNVTVTLSSELANSITLNGSTVPLSFSRVGQNARLTVSGTVGQRINLGLSGVTLGSPCCTNVGTGAIFKPDGSPLLSPVGFMQDGLGSPTLILPTTGTYAITVDPVLSHTGNVSVTASEELASSITINGSPVPLTISRPGQNARVTFEGTEGQVVSLGLSGVTLGAPCCSNVGTVTIFKPDGTTLVAPVGFDQSGFGTANVQLPATGTYAITIDPVLVNTGNVTLTLSEAVSSTVSVNGGAVPLTISRVGQNAVLTFNGTANTQITVSISGNNIGGITVSLVKPDGSVLTSLGGSGNSFNLATQTLPVSGVYTITVDPSGTSTGSVNVAATSP